MTQDSSEKNETREESTRRELNQAVTDIAFLNESQKVVRAELWRRSKLLEGHLKLAHEFASQVVGELMFHGVWHHWSSSKQGVSKTLRHEWHDNAGEAVASRRFIDFIIEATEDPKNQLGGSVLVGTREDIASVLAIASCLPGISNSMHKPFAGEDAEDFDPARMGRLHHEVHHLDELLTQIQKNPEN